LPDPSTSRFPTTRTTGGALDNGPVVGAVDVGDVESQTLIPHEVAFGSVKVVPLAAEAVWFLCPQPTVTSAPNAITATTRTE
jgi:hypothetical protein